MNTNAHDEFEDVESPFVERPSRLRTQKNVFNRPFAAESLVAPAVIEPAGSKRRSIGRANETELNHHRQSELSETQISYLEEEDEEVEVEEEALVVRKPRSNNSPKKAAKSKKLVLRKAAWSVIGLLVLRLICMDRGVWDYFTTNNSIQGMQQELKGIQKENRDIKAEIGKIQLDKNYQKQLAKEHLGVIAADEFLILFAGESSETTSSQPLEQI